MAAMPPTDVALSANVCVRSTVPAIRLLVVVLTKTKISEFGCLMSTIDQSGDNKKKKTEGRKGGEERRSSVRRGTRIFIKPSEFMIEVALSALSW